MPKIIIYYQLRFFSYAFLKTIVLKFPSARERVSAGRSLPGVSSKEIVRHVTPPNGLLF